MKKICALLLAVTALPAQAKNFDINQVSCPSAITCQQAFDSMSKDALALIDYKALNPAEATGLSGIGVGVVVSYLPVKSKSDWKTVTGADFSGIGMVGLQVTKGLPLGIDLGAFYSVVPTTDVKVYGGELRYAILKGSTATPALALRGSYVTVTGIDNLKLDSKAVDLALSKGFTLFTPYVGVGYAWGDSKANVSGLKEVKANNAKGFVGLRIALGFFELTPEVERLGDLTAYSLRLGFSF